MTTVRIAHPIGGRPSPDQFGKVFHVASPLQDQIGVITPSSLHYVATTRGSYIPDIRAVDISISPQGDELPAGHGNAKEGAEVYEQAGCISCHGEKGLDGPAPQLRSRKADNLPIWERERILPLRAPFATVVWDFINRGMPLGAEGSLSANEVYAVTAYLLFLNKVIPEDLVLDKDSLPKVKMPIGDDYAKLPEWQHGTPRLKGYPY